MYGVDLYRRLAAETGVDPGWHEVGSLRLASTPERHAGAPTAGRMGRRRSGCRSRIVSTDEALERFPLFDPTGVLGAAWLPTDGQLDPSNLTLALAEGARAAAARDPDGHARSPASTSSDGRVRGVATRASDGPIDADVVVNAGGIYANADRPAGGRRGPGRAVRAPVPAHQADRGRARRDLPTMRDPDRLVYFRARRAAGW